MSRALTKSNKRTAQRPKSYRFDARLNEEQKLIIQKAADLKGRSMTDFVLRSTQAATERTIEARATLVMSARESKASVKAILQAVEPGAVLRAAARRYKKIVAE